MEMIGHKCKSDKINSTFFNNLSLCFSWYVKHRVFNVRRDIATDVIEWYLCLEEKDAEEKPGVVGISMKNVFFVISSVVDVIKLSESKFCFSHADSISCATLGV